MNKKLDTDYNPFDIRQQPNVKKEPDENCVKGVTICNAHLRKSMRILLQLAISPCLLKDRKWTMSRGKLTQNYFTKNGMIKVK